MIAGTGTQGYAGDGGSATAALLNAPQAIALAADGTLYIADTGNNCLRAVSPSGTINTVATALHTPSALALEASGSVLLADTAAHRVLRLSGTTLTTIAGTGAQGFGGDSGPATAALLDSPSGLAVLTDGRILIADTHNHRLRAVALDGTISTVAGTGTRGFSGDNGPATAAQLALPRGLTALPDGTILIADSDNHRLRAISPTGIITTLLGNGAQGISPDGTSVSTALLDTPRAVASTPYGAPVFTDRTLQALLSQHLYAAATETPRSSTLTLSATSSLATVTVQGTAGTPQGSVTLNDNGTTLSTTALSNATANIPLAPTPGAHALTATYSGDAFNPAASASTSINAALIPSTTALATPTVSYAGLPLTLSATVSPVAATGTVRFTEGGALIANSPVRAGGATGVYLAPTSGQHSIVATYSGDANYAPSTSATALATVAPMPDFTLAVVGPATQTASNGATLSYTFAITASPAPFSGAVSLSATGLPATTAVTFAPAQVIPGASSATTVMSIPTDKLLASTPTIVPLFYALLALPILLRRRRILPLAALLLLAGCGTRIAPGSAASAPSRSYTVTVTAIGTNLAGVLVSHSTQVTVTVQ